MKNNPTGFWGKLKKDNDGNILAWHPLIDHCADVAACCEVLLAQTNIRQRIAACGELEDFNAVQTHRLCVLAALHDVGKFNIGFQNKAIPNPPFIKGHVAETVYLFAGNSTVWNKFVEALQLRQMNSWAKHDSLCRLLIASISHHGKPVNCQSGNSTPSIWQPARGIQPMQGIADLSSKVRQWFPNAFTNEAPPLPENAELQHAFSGLIMLADWLGSDEQFFPFTNENDGDRIFFSRKRALEICQKIFLNPQKAVQALGNNLGTFKDLFGFPPRSIQTAIDELPITVKGSITIFEAETGSGKTEAAFQHFLRLFHAKKVDGLYFALPTRTAATQIHKRLHDYALKVFGENAPPVTLAVPGYIQVDTMKGEKLANFDVLWPDEERFRFRGWASEHPKRYLAGCIVVGTVDQVMLSALTVKHAHLRATALFRHLLVIDEVHASDAYMIRILQEVLARHVSGGGHALLMSATLGAEMRQRLCKIETPILFQDAANTAYPVVWAQKDPITVDSATEQKIVNIQLLPILENTVEIAAQAICAAREGAKVIVLRNTVGGALKVQLALESAASKQKGMLFNAKGINAPHHARFSKEDRVTLDEALQENYGKGKRPQAGCIVVATQTVQQSLDIDADLLFTDLCPMDVMLQRIGRLHRHERTLDERPFKYRNPNMVVLVPQERDMAAFIRKNGDAYGPKGSGIGTVYRDLCILEATWRLLEKYPMVEIPRMNRNLVETAIHSSETDKIVKEKGEAWQAHKNKIWGEVFGQRQTAQLSLVEWDKPFGEYHFGDAAEKIKTRLGEGDRLVVFEKPFISPFGNPVSNITIPAYWVHDAESEEKPSEIMEKPGKVFFHFGNREFIYDRLGLRPYKVEDDNKPEDDLVDQ